MVAGRIEGKKGVLPVAKVCHELGYKFILAGKISDPEYFNEILKYKPTLALDISNDELNELYKQSALHVCNSVDGFESGTLPILEAIATGVPVLTRNVGYIPDLQNDGIFVREGQPEDEEELKDIIGMLMEDHGLREKMRSEAWSVIKDKNSFRRAIKQYKVWRKMIYSDSEFVSVVIPTYNRPDQLKETLSGFKDQTYTNFEIIVADDNSETNIEEIAREFSNKTNIVTKYVNTNYQGYGLAKARNMGICEADGDIVIFNDDRWKPRPDLIIEFLKNLKEKHFICANIFNLRNYFLPAIRALTRKSLLSRMNRRPCSVHS